MNLYVDISNKRLLFSATSSMAASTPVFTRGDNEVILVKLLTYENGTLTACPLASGETLNVGIGKSKDGKALYALSEVNSFESDGSAKVSLNLNTESLAEALLNKGSLKALLEIELCGSDGAITTIAQTECIVKNDVISNDEVPADLPSIAALQEEILTLRNALQEACAVYDKSGNLLTDKVVWTTVKIAEDVYTQKWKRIQ